MDIRGESDFKITVGMLLGPKDFPVFYREIILDISKGSECARKRELLTLSLMKSRGDFSDRGIFLVIPPETLTKYLLRMLVMTIGSDILLPLESLSLLSICLLAV